MKTFYRILGNTLIASFTNNFVWFALTFWAYLETKSVLATSIIAGIYLVTTALSSIWFGSIVDHHKKKSAMILSSFVTLLFFALGFFVYISFPESTFQSISNPIFWSVILLLMFGVTAGNIRNIAVPTTVTILVEEDRRDKANGLSGSMFGISFALTSVASGIALANLGMFGVLLISLVCTVITIVHMFTISIPEKDIVHVAGTSKKIDIRGTIAVIAAIPGLFALIFFNSLNNFLGGVFMSLMDAYGLSLVSVQTWGFIWGGLSLGFILGGIIIAKKGLGKSPLRTIFIANIAMWIVSIFFTIQASIILLTVGMFIWICLVPFVEAAEQTVIQKVVPADRQGRVFGFAQSVEQAASPITAFLIGPLAQFVFIPFMTTGSGVELIGDWFGTGTGRGIALVFIATGILGLILTIFAMRSNPAKLLAKEYQK